MRQVRVTPSQVSARLRTIRGESVLLDADVAVLFGISAVEQANCVEACPELFPDDFVFALECHEVITLPTDTAGLPPRFAFTMHGVALLVGQFDSQERGRTLVEVLRGFGLPRFVLGITN